MESLRVCHIIHDTQCGGTELMLYKLIRSLKDRHEFSVLSLMGCGDIGKAICDLGVPVHSLHVAEGGKPKPLRLYRAVSNLRKLKPDVVQTWAYHADLVGGVASRIATNASVVWNIRHSTLEPGLDSANVTRSARICGRLSGWVPDRILLNAESAVSVHKAAGYRGEKMHIIPNGFDTQEFRPLPDEGRAVREELGVDSGALLVGMCGRFHPHKGQEQFVEVAKLLASQRANLHFVVSGRGCDEQNLELKRWVNRAGLADRFHLLGTRTDMPRLLNSLDVYLLPSLTEAMPNVVGEAMACGIPVVATNVGDAGKLMGDCSQLVLPKDIGAMAAATNKIFEMSAPQRLELGKRHRQQITDHYELSRIATRYEKVWEDALAERRLARPWIPGFRGPKVRSARSLKATSLVPANETLVAKPKLVHVTTIPMTQWLFLRGQFPFMANAGFDVHSVSSPGGYLDDIKERDPVTTHPITISRQIQPLQDAKTVYQLFRLFRRLRPEIVQLSTPKAALLGAIAAKAARVPVRIYQVRGLSSESESGLTRWIFQKFERFTAALCNGYLVNAASLLAYAKRSKILRSGLVAGQGMSNGVDLERFNAANIAPADMAPWDKSWDLQTGPVIGFVGRLTHDKGLEDIFQAWTNIREEHPAARLLLVGPWENENAVSRQCYNGLHDDPRVVLTGTQHNVAQFYRRMDVFVYPSHGTEGFPNAPMEAAAMQLPVIATRVVGCVDAVADGETGCVIPPRDPQSLEAALRRYLDSPLLRKQHGAAGRHRIRTGFAPQDLWKEFCDYYVHLLRRSQLQLPTPEQPADEKRAA